MKFNDIVYIVILILLILAAIIFYIVNLRNVAASIKNYLIKRGATSVAVSHNWFDFDRDTLTFDVAYIGVKGNKLSTRCKIRHWAPFTDDQIFWSNPLSLELVEHVQIEKEMPKSEFYDFSKKIRTKLSSELPTYEISTVLPIGNSEDQIVMMKYSAAFRNVFRCKPDGSVVWQAELPTESGDVYTNIEWKDNNLNAFSRSCIAVNLDVNTGNILKPKDS